MRKNRRLIFGIVILVIITSVVSFVVSASIFYGGNYFNPKNCIYFNAEEINPENIKKFNKVKKILKNSFYKGVDENIMLEGAISGMTDSLDDPYTVYFTREQMKTFMEKSKGSFFGIGVLVMMDKDGLLTVIEPYEGTPAKKAGVKQGDKITKVDGEDVTKIKDINVIVSMIKGKRGTPVKITVYRESENKFLDFDIIRDKIKIRNISSKVIDHNTGYIRIKEFDSEIANYFDEHLDKLLAQGIKGLIIDLRNNPGGAYDQVVNIADRLLPEGLIVSVKDRYGKEAKEKSDTEELNIPIAVLINEHSASASEILAGAIKDHNKGVLVGAKTFGKGLVQNVIELDDGSGLKVTVARYYTPSGVCIQGVGVEPDIEVHLDEKFRYEPLSQIPEDQDLQLEKAKEAVRGKIKQ